jgi:hypothetical protein
LHPKNKQHRQVAGKKKHQKQQLQRQTSKYKSKFEAAFAESLHKKKIVFTYESISVDYQISCCYKPDFILNNFIVETKGYFSKEDRRKHLIIKATRPDLDIRFCFQNSKTRLSKAKKSLTYGAWCDRHGFLYCDKTIPNDWYEKS